MIQNGPPNLIRLVNALQEEEVPKGWKTKQEWAAELDRSESHTSKVLIQAVQKGLMYRKNFRKMDAAGGVRLKPYYKLK